MAQPIVAWYDKEETSPQSLYDAGIVDAGSESEVTEYHIWNNRGGSSDVPDMINTTMTVRDSSGASTDLAVAGQRDAIVMVQFYDSVKQEWGANSSGVWTKDAWNSLIYNENHDVISASGIANVISGRSNSANAESDTANYAKVRIKVYAKPTANSGQADWLTRVSYQYI